jgi:curved DNA-binding protein CbpA
MQKVMNVETYYAALGVSETATPLEIKAAYRNLLKKIHPDTVSTLSPNVKRIAEDATQEIIEAYSVLSDAGQRREYDRELAEFRQQSVPVALPRQLKTPPTSVPRTYVSPPTRLPQPQAGAWKVSVGVFSALFVIVWLAIAIPAQHSDSDGSPEPLQTDSVLQQTSETASNPVDIAGYCSTHPMSFYGARDNPLFSSLSCSDWARLTTAEQQSVQAECNRTRNNEGYELCLARELKEWESRPKRPDLSSLPTDEEASIQGACTHAQYDEGLAAYELCVVGKFKEWQAGPKPDLSRVKGTGYGSIRTACYGASLEGPAAYDRCVVRELKEQ